MKTGSFLGQSPLGPHRIAYTEWGENTGGTPVLCVHALTFNGRSFDRLAEDLSVNRRVYCPDITGRGKSDWLGDPAYYHNHYYIPDMIELIARTGAGQVDWVGTSMGGLIGIMVAAMPNSPIRRLVLNDIGPYVALDALHKIGAYLSAMPTSFANIEEVGAFLRKTYGAFGNLTDTDWRHLSEHDVRQLSDGRVARGFDPAIAQTMVTATEPIDLWESYDKITCPTLVLHGETSGILTAEIAEEMTRRGPRPTVITYPGIGHAPALMDQEQIDTVINFLNDPIH